MLPAIQDGPGEAALTMTDKKADAVVFRGNCTKDLFCAVAVVVVDVAVADKLLHVHAAFFEKVHFPSLSRHGNHKRDGILKVVR